MKRKHDDDVTSSEQHRRIQEALQVIKARLGPARVQVRDVNDAELLARVEAVRRRVQARGGL